MMEQLNAKITDMQVTVSARDYITDFRNVDKFMAMCRQCRNFGRQWSCPPFAEDWTDTISGYSHVTLFATKIEPIGHNIPLAEVLGLFRTQRRRIEPLLLRLEKDTGGLAFSFAGECLCCPEGECARVNGERCRHPELVRPSLEAVGFDIGKTTEQLFSLPLKWSADGHAPEYLVLVCGLFHNRS